MQRILTKDVHLHAYKIQLTQEIKPRDHVQREKKISWPCHLTQWRSELAAEVV
jgi:hypothetical protein